MSDFDPEAETPGTTNDPCSCCGATGESNGASVTPSGGWPGDEQGVDAKLPGDLQRGLGRVLGEPPVATLEEWVGAVRRRTGGGPIAVEDLCHTDEETGHRGEMDGETYHFRCFYDAVILSALAETPVDVRTESPGGAVIEARATGTSRLTVTPREAVFSFGIDEDVEPSADGEPSRADVYAAVCPYVRAFPDAAAYERWARRAPAVTVSMPLVDATGVAAALVE